MWHSLPADVWRPFEKFLGEPASDAVVRDFPPVRVGILRADCHLGSFAELDNSGLSCHPVTVVGCRIVDKGPQVPSSRSM